MENINLLETLILTSNQRGYKGCVIIDSEGNDFVVKYTVGGSVVAIDIEQSEIYPYENMVALHNEFIAGGGYFIEALVEHIEYELKTLGMLKDAN